MLPGSAHLQEIRVLFSFGVLWVWLPEEYGKEISQVTLRQTK